MKPNASIAARISAPARKIRMRPPRQSPPPANSSTPKPAATTWSRRKRQLRKNNPAALGAYWEIGGAGGPAGATGGSGGAEAVTAGGAGGAAGADGAGAGSGVPLETAADTAGESDGAGVTGGTGSARSAGVSPLPVSFGASILAASDLPSPDGLVFSGLVPSGLLSSPLAASVFAVSDLAASAFAALRPPACLACSASASQSICGHRGHARSQPGPELHHPRRVSRPRALLPVAPAAWRCGLDVRARLAGKVRRHPASRPAAAQRRAWQPLAVVQDAACAQTGRVGRVDRQASPAISHPCPAWAGCRQSGYRPPRSIPERR